MNTHIKVYGLHKLDFEHLKNKIWDNIIEHIIRDKPERRQRKMNMANGVKEKCIIGNVRVKRNPVSKIKQEK